MRFILSTVKELKEKYPKLELNHVPDANPVYKREYPHVKKYSKDTQNKGIISNEITPQSMSNKSSCLDVVSDDPNISLENNDKCFTSNDISSNWGTSNRKSNQ